MKKGIDLSEMHINLRELWTTSYDKLPDWVDSENVIYKIENLINGKVYIGQARWFYGRFIINGFSHKGGFQDYCHNGYSNSYLYNSIRKYHSRNFEVSIINILESSDDLDAKEIERISEFNSYGEGYNMNSGGECHEQLFTLESRKKALNSIANQYNGDCAGQLHTKESYETNRRNHGGLLAYNTSESISKSLNTRIKKYNGDCMGQCRTPEALEKSRETNSKNYNGDPYGQLNTPEARKAAYISRSIYYNGDGYGQIHTSESRYKGNISRSIHYIKNVIDYIKNWHPDLKDTILTFELYWYHCDIPTQSARLHISRVLSRIDDLRNDPRWTPEMENIFGYVENHKEDIPWLS